MKMVEEICSLNKFENKVKDQKTKKEMKIMSNSFINPTVLISILALIKESIIPSKYVYRNCGHM